jgi:riboflavin kinase/FMN adenylyltransferase
MDGAWLTIGVFDGVHLGHQALINQLTAGAHANSAPAVVLTFNPHPAVVLAGRQIPVLTTLDERAGLLFQLGVDVVISLEFTRELAAQSAHDFMQLVTSHLGLKKLLIGYDFALGRDRAGNFEHLSQVGTELGFQVSALEPVLLGQGIISSTQIRQTLASGDVRAASAMLGRPYSLSGPVVPGDGRGRTIGIPTANVDVPTPQAMPMNGVYACWALLEDQPHPAVVNIGLRPTFTAQGATGEILPRIEAHLLDQHTDLYGRTLTLQFVERLRDEQKFPSIDALVTQIQADIRSAHGLLLSAQ